MKLRITIKHIYESLISLFKTTHKQGESIMSAIENLNVAIGSLQAEVTKVSAVVVDLKAQIAALQGANNDVAIQGAADAVTAQVTSLDQAIS